MTLWLHAKAFMHDCISSSWAIRLRRRCEPFVARLSAWNEQIRDETIKAWQRYQAWVAAREVMVVDRQFLPAVMELQETPPSPTARLFLRGICIAIGLALLWSIIGTVDITAVAPGKIIPTGRVKVIQPLDAGVVSAIHVEDGTQVKAGDVLVELDLTQTGADKERLTSEKAVLESDIERLDALIQGKPMPLFEGVSQSVAAMQSSLFAEMSAKIASEVGVLDDELRQRESELADATQQSGRLATTVKLMNDRAARVRKLVAEGFYARNRFDMDETERLRLTREMESARAHIVQGEAAVSGARQRLTAAKAELNRTLLAELAEKHEKHLAVSKDLEKADQRNRLQTLTAPIDGTVQELEIHTLGGVVTPAQELMKVVPFEDALEAEVTIENKDVGFVEVGQEVAVKLEAFPFTKYGTVGGVVKTLSLDAVPDEKLGLVYKARIGLNESTIRVGEKDVVLGPGLALSAEVKTGTRRIIEYVLSPLAEYIDEAGRER